MIRPGKSLFKDLLPTPLINIKNHTNQLKMVNAPEFSLNLDPNPNPGTQNAAMTTPTSTAAAPTTTNPPSLSVSYFQLATSTSDLSSMDEGPWTNIPSEQISLENPLPPPPTIAGPPGPNFARRGGRRYMPSYRHVVTSPDASEDEYRVRYPNVVSTLHYRQAVRNTSRYGRTTCYLGRAEFGSELVWIPEDWMQEHDFFAARMMEHASMQTTVGDEQFDERITRLEVINSVRNFLEEEEVRMANR